MKYDWIRTDDRRAVRRMNKIGNVWECIQVCGDGENGGFYHYYIDVSEYIGTDEFDEILHEFGYADWEEVRSLYGIHARQIAAEFIFETICGGCFPNAVYKDEKAMKLMLDYIKSGKEYVEFMNQEEAGGNF